MHEFMHAMDEKLVDIMSYLLSFAVIGQFWISHHRLFRYVNDYNTPARRVYAKDIGIPALVFARTGPPQLVLISCGGPFDAERGSYRDNIAVFAMPAR